MRYLVGVCLILLILSASLMPLVFNRGDLASKLMEMVPQSDREFSGHIFEAVRKNDVKTLKPLLEASLVNDSLQGNLKSLAGLFPQEEPRAVRVVGWDSLSLNGVTSVTMVSEYEFSHQWVLFQLVMEQANGKTTIHGIHAEPQKESLESQTAFHLLGQDAKHYAWLSTAVFLSLLTAWAAWRCVTTPGLPRKKRWCFFILLGVCDFQLNWTSGEWAVLPFNFCMPPVRATAAPYGPWILQLCIPVGALAYFWFRPDLQKNSNTPMVLASPEPCPDALT